MKAICQLLAISIVGVLFTWGCQSNTPTTTTEGTTESPSPVAEKGSFDEELYLFANSEVAELIKQGKYKSGLDHYLEVGQTATKPDGEHYGSFFTGTEGNDTVQGIGKGEHAHFTGVALEIVPNQKDPFPLRPKNLGKGEMDILIGTTEGGNEFLLGSFITSVNPSAQPFYVGQGDADYAKIQNFTQSKDVIILAGKPEQYKWESSEGNTHIYTQGDLIAIVEGIDKLEVGGVYEEFGVFELK